MGYRAATYGMRGYFSTALIIVLIFLIMSSVKTEADATSANGSPLEKPATNPSQNTSGRQNKPSRWGQGKSVSVSPFKGGIPEIFNKVFIIGPSQATKYGEAYKTLLHYFGKNSTTASIRHLKQRMRTPGWRY